jgi:hypothetical protein
LVDDRLPSGSFTDLKTAMDRARARFDAAGRAFIDFEAPHRHEDRTTLTAQLYELRSAVDEAQRQVSALTERVRDETP